MHDNSIVTVEGYTQLLLMAMHGYPSIKQNLCMHAVSACTLAAASY